VKNRILAFSLSLVMAISPLTGVNAQSSETKTAAAGGAASGISVGTAVALGIVGAVLLASIGSDSDAAPAGLINMPTTATSATTTTTTTTTTTATTTTTTSN